MATILKVQHGSDIRRLNLTHFSSYPDFVQLVRTIFNISELSGLKLMYQDEDKDFINIRSDMDLTEARRYAEQLPSFKIHVLLADGISPFPHPSEVSYPQLAPEDVEGDLTSSFAELLSDSMRQEGHNKTEEEQNVDDAKVPMDERVPEAEKKVPKSEQSFRESLDALSGSAASSSGHEPGVFDTMEVKFKKALEALVEFVESLHLDAKVKQIVSELEPSFAKFEAQVLNPINDFGLKASRGLQSEMSSIHDEVNQLKEKLNARYEELKRQHEPKVSSPPHALSAPPAAPSSPSPLSTHPAAAPVPPQAEQHMDVGHNAMQDLQQLEAMGFTDRRHNLELLAAHKGDLSRVIDQLLG